MIYLLLFYVRWYFECIYIYVRILDPLEAEFQAVVSCHVGAEN